MTAESGDITWAAPADDGGSAVTRYIVEKKDVSRKSWNEAGKLAVEEDTALEFTVPKLLEGQQYLFRVSAENQYGVSEPVTLTEPVTAKNPYSE
jgi:titin